MTKKRKDEIVLSLIALAMAGVSPNLWPAAAAGYAGMPFLSRWVLIPAIIILFIVCFLAYQRNHERLFRRMTTGAAAGVIATLGLEVVRQFGFHHGWMPGDMPKLLGVLITHRFMLGPDTTSNILGYLYHFWNGVSFGMIFMIILGRKSFNWGIGYALLIGTGFLLSPSVQSMGIGFMGSGLPGMIVTVYAAHIVYGSVLGYLGYRWLKQESWLFG